MPGERSGSAERRSSAAGVLIRGGPREDYDENYGQ